MSTQLQTSLERNKEMADIPSSINSRDSEKETLLKQKAVSVNAPPLPNEGTNWRVTLYLSLLGIFSATGGFLFGYDTGVVSGAMLKVDQDFHLSSLWHELIVSTTIAAAAIAAALAGPLTQWFGRKPVLMLASVTFTVGAAVMGGSPDKYVLLSGRVIVGLGIGLAAMAVPMYIAESAPVHLRGKLVVMNNLFITGGQFIATLIDGALSGLKVDIGWRFMLGLAGIPSVIMFIGFLFMPESPRWLVFKGKPEKAKQVLYKLRSDPTRVNEEFAMIEADFEEYKSLKLGTLDLLKKFFTSRSVVLALIVGCGLQIFQQLGGINTVMYYGASIIEMSGFSASESIWLATIPAGGNFIFTIVGLLLVDRMGRRNLLICSLVGVVLSLLLLSGSFLVTDYTSDPAKPLSMDKDSCSKYHSCASCIGNSKCGFCAVLSPNSSLINGTCARGNSTQSFHYFDNQTSQCEVFSDQYHYSFYDDAFMYDNNNDTIGNRRYYFNSCPDAKYAWLSLVSLFLYIMFFAPGMGPLPWTVNSEIYPTWARSTAVAIATATNWIFNLFVSLTFLTFADVLGQPQTFGFYAGLSFLGLLFVIFLVPETKGRSLEEMDVLFKKPYFLWWFS